MNNNMLLQKALNKIIDEFQLISVRVDDKNADHLQTQTVHFEIKVSHSFIKFALNYHSELLYIELTNLNISNQTINILNKLKLLFGDIKS